jgi:tetratricopeptide (TPR) repeat protein
MKTLSALLLSFLLIGSAQAASKKSAQKSKEEAREKASELFSKSKAYYNIHEYQKALDGFKEAYILSQESVLLLNMGQCYRYLGQYQDAIVSYQTFLQEDPATPYASNVDALIQEMQQKLVELKAPEPVVTLPEAKPEQKPESKQLPPAMLSDEPYRTPSILYGATAAAFVLGAGAGGLAVVLSRKEDEIVRNGAGVPQNDLALEENQQQQKTAKGAMIGLGVVSVVTATTGILLYRRHKHHKKELAPIEPLFNEPGVLTAH